MLVQTRLQGARMNYSTLQNHLSARGYAQKTVSDYMNAIARAQGWMREHHWTLDTCPAPVVAQYCNTLPPSRASRNLMRSALKAYWEVTGRKDGPLGAIRVPSKPKRKTRALHPDQATALGKVAYEWDEGPDGLVVLFGLHVAMRRFEIAKLRWDEFHHDFTEVTFVGKKDKEGTLPVRGRLRERLLWWKDEWVNPTDPTDMQTRRGDEWLFNANNKNCSMGHMHPYTVDLMTKRVAKRAGIEHITTHQLRHTCLTTLNDMGMSLRTVQEYARHEDPEVTSGYTRVTISQMEECADLLPY